MVLEFCALASGSKGNAVFAGSGHGGALIDAGVSASEIERRLDFAGIPVKRVGALVITHGHSDHIRGVGVFARRFGVPVYAPAGTVAEMEAFLPQNALRGVRVVEFSPGEVFEAGGLEFASFPTSHDAAVSVGFRVFDGAKTLGHATDLGCVSSAVAQCLSGCDIVCLESNHDEEMLKTGPYPAFLKKRILSDRGHLSNEVSAGLLESLLHDGLKAVVLSHLSEVNNRPALAFEAAMRILERQGAQKDVTLLVARQERPGRVVEF